jgi:hypothetical protein
MTSLGSLVRHNRAGHSLSSFLVRVMPPRITCTIARFGEGYYSIAVVMQEERSGAHHR